MDARIHLLEQGLSQRSVARIVRDSGRREAAVALVLRTEPDIELLLIKRAEHEKDPWSGHMALPGGRRSAGDADLRQTAYRETAEEIGIALESTGHYLGALDEVAPVTPRLPPLIIAPYVAAVPPGTIAVANPVEVEFAVWVPLRALRDPSAAGELLIEFEGVDRTLPSLRYGEHVIWGLTLRILNQFFEVMQECGL